MWSAVVTDVVPVIETAAVVFSRGASSAVPKFAPIPTPKFGFEAVAGLSLIHI